MSRSTRPLLSLLRVSFGAVALLGAGCGSKPPTDPMPIAPLSDDLCPGDGRFALSADPASIRPAVPVDWIEIRHYTPGAADFVVSSSWGTRCATASDRPRCEAALAALPPMPRLGPGRYRDAVDLLLVYTRGDEVEALRTGADVLAFLGPIDTPAEAAWVGSWWGTYEVLCRQSIGRTPTGDWEVNFRAIGHCGGLYLQRMTVGVDGRQEWSLGRTTLEAPPDTVCY